MTKPHIPLSECRKLWRMAGTSYGNYAPRARDTFRGYVHDEVQRRRIKALEAENRTLRATLESTRQRLERVLDSSIAEAVRFEQLETEIAALRNELELSMKETGDLRQAITEAVDMPWDEQPQPLGGMGYACPDDVRIVEFVANMRARIAECESDAVTVAMTKPRVEAIKRIIDYMSRDTRAMVEDEIAIVRAMLDEVKRVRVFVRRPTTEGVSDAN